MDNVDTSTWVFDKDEDGKGIVDEYVGGYQEYLIQKNRMLSIKSNTTTIKTKQKPVSVPAKVSKVAKKLSFNEQRELDSLPKQIATLETEQNQLQVKLADGSWFIQDFDAATLASERLLVIEEEMMDKLERWEALEQG